MTKPTTEKIKKVMRRLDKIENSEETLERSRRLEMTLHEIPFVDLWREFTI